MGERKNQGSERVSVAELAIEFHFQPEAMRAWLADLRQLQLTSRERRAGSRKRNSPTRS